jgi:hypothetical protein
MFGQSRRIELPWWCAAPAAGRRVGGVAWSGPPCVWRRSRLLRLLLRVMGCSTCITWKPGQRPRARQRRPPSSPEVDNLVGIWDGDPGIPHRSSVVIIQSMTNFGLHGSKWKPWLNLYLGRWWNRCLASLPCRRNHFF